VCSSDLWQRISWDQAVDEIAGQLAVLRDRYGPETFVQLGGTVHGPGDWAGWRFCNLFGSPNIFGQGKNCGEAELLTECATYGYDTAYSSPRPGLTKCIIVWGANPAESAHLFWRGIKKVKDAGAKLIVVDPRPTECTSEADVWVRLRPATDGALALGMLHVMIKEGLYDEEFVSRWCLGFEEVKRLVEGYTPERTAEITWVPAEQIVEIARIYGTHKPGIITFGVATCHLGSNAGKSAVQAKAILRAVSGNLDVEGGNVLGNGFTDKIAWLENLHWDKLVDHPLRRRDSVGAEQFPMASVRSYVTYREGMQRIHPLGYGGSQYMVWMTPSALWPAILEGNPYQVSAMVTQGGNPLLTLANSRYIYQALKSERLQLHVVMDFFMTPSAQLADYVLPAADNLERPDVSVRWGLPGYYLAAEQCVPPRHERRNDYDLWRDLGCRLGQAEYWPATYEGMLDKLLEPAGKTFREFAAQPEPWHFMPNAYRKHEQRGFATYSGKVELLPSVFAKLGYDPLPEWDEPAESPVRSKDLAQEYPLILVSGARVRHFTHSSHRQLERLRKARPEPIVMINPKVAAKLGIADGDWVYIETALGKVKQRARPSEEIDPRVVSADGYWWFPEQAAYEPNLSGVWQSNINAVISDDPRTNDWAGDQFFRGPLCKVYQAEDGFSS
jgi:anaerobic selenocysteine-containing dehydrogenase